MLRKFHKLLVVAGVLSLIVFFGAPPAMAHAEFDYSVPSDSAQVDEPVSEILVVFTAQAEPVGDGFVLIDEEAAAVDIESLTSEDGQTWVLRLASPLESGNYGVRWSVQAPDAHPIDGAFRFTVRSSALGSTTSQSSSSDFDEALSTPGPAPLVGPVATLARWVGFMGAILGIGGAFFAAFVLKGPDQDIRSVLFWVRRAAVLVAVGALGEFVAQTALVNGHWWTVYPFDTVSGVLFSSMGAAIVLRIAGAALLLRAHLGVMFASDAPDHVRLIHDTVGVGAVSFSSGEVPLASEPWFLHPKDMTWSLTSGARVVFWACFSIALSYVFDGHTVTEGNRYLTGLINVVHVGAAAVWAGGLLMLFLVVWRRRKRGSESRSLQLGVRFSVIAALSLVVAGVGGFALTAIVLDDFASLWSTGWGRLVMAKFVLVGAAGAAGAYNHFVLIPAMATGKCRSGLEREFRRAVTLEAIVILFVLLVTALLVGSAS